MTPLLGTPCETRNSQRLEVAALFRKQTQWPKGWGWADQKPPRTQPAHKQRTHPKAQDRAPAPTSPSPDWPSGGLPLPPEGHLGWGQSWKEERERAAVPAPSSAPFAFRRGRQGRRFPREASVLLSAKPSSGGWTWCVFWGSQGAAGACAEGGSGRGEALLGHTPLLASPPTQRGLRGWSWGRGSAPRTPEGQGE